LVGSAGLSAQLKALEDGDQTFSANWAIVAQWTPEARYETTDRTSAELIVNAIADPKSGVLQWIKTHW
jgi:hypothetical protein